MGSMMKRDDTKGFFRFKNWWRKIEHETTCNFVTLNITRGIRPGFKVLDWHWKSTVNLSNVEEKSPISFLQFSPGSSGISSTKSLSTQEFSLQFSPGSPVCSKCPYKMRIILNSYCIMSWGTNPTMMTLLASRDEFRIVPHLVKHFKHTSHR